MREERRFFLLFFGLKLFLTKTIISKVIKMISKIILIFNRIISATSFLSEFASTFVLFLLAIILQIELCKQPLFGQMKSQNTGHSFSNCFLYYKIKNYISQKNIIYINWNVCLLFFLKSIYYWYASQKNFLTKIKLSKYINRHLGLHETWKIVFSFIFGLRKFVILFKWNL